MIIGYKVVDIMMPQNKIISPEEARAKAENFINDNLMSPGTSATVKDVTDEGDLYKVVVSVGDQDIDSYISKDGSKFFPQALEMPAESPEQSAAAQTQASGAKVAVQTDRPVVELFVMSYCPYGTQIEKGILPVLETLGDKIDFQLKFCDYAMHGQQELNEELNQYCIQKEEPGKLLGYLSAFLEAGDSGAALSQAGIDASKINVCIAATDQKFKVTEKYNDQTTWRGSYPVFDVDKSDNVKYGVGGSPTLVINGQEVSSGRSPAALLSTICSAFNEAPAVCGQNLATATPAPGFGYDTTTGSASGSCN